MQYGLSASDVVRGLTDTAEQYFSYRFRQPVTAELRNGSFILRKYSPSFDGYRETEIILQKKDLRPMAHLLRETFQSVAASVKFPFLKGFIHTAVEGSVDFRTAENAVIKVSSGFSGTVLGVCPKRNIPQRERYSFSGSFRFYVTGMSVYEKEPALMLSRTNRTLVEKLFEEKGDTVRCIHRIAGAKSEVFSDKRIAGKNIKAVADELRERIIVRFT